MLITGDMYLLHSAKPNTVQHHSIQGLEFGFSFNFSFLKTKNNKKKN